MKRLIALTLVLGLAGCMGSDAKKVESASAPSSNLEPSPGAFLVVTVQGS